MVPHQVEFVQLAELPNAGSTAAERALCSMQY
jgi:hypothetical protein